jgi:septum formation protein
MICQPDNPVILASLSPRRRELLQDLGLKFSLVPPQIDEKRRKGERILAYVRRIAREKGGEIARAHPDSVVISADTIVTFRKSILGKPRNAKDAIRMLKMLSGNTHVVITAYAVHCRDLAIFWQDDERTKVRFRKLSDQEISAYVRSASALDKAGAYGIQDLHANFVRRIDGCFYNVTGFPLPAFAEKWNSLFSKS